MPYVAHLPGSRALIAAVARRTRRRLAAFRPALEAIDAGRAGSLLAGVATALGHTGAEGTRALSSGALRALASDLEAALSLRLAAERALAATPARGREAAVATLFEAVAATPHLLATAPRQVPDRGFPRRVAALADRLLGAALADLPLALIAHLPGTHRGLPLRARENAETATAAREFPIGGTPLLLCCPRGAPALSVDLTEGELILRSRRRVLLRASRRPLAPTPAAAKPGAARIDELPRIAGSRSLRLGRRLISSPRALRVGAPVPGLEGKLGRALSLLEAAWPEAAEEVHLFTELVVPLDEPGTVSYSLPARPGVSYINVWRKPLLQLTDDLLHETAHHKLHAVEELEPLVRDGGEPIWWSPWRRAWRPLRGIVHALYTFTYGALLFAALLGREPASRRLSVLQRRFAARRLLEEEASLAFSIADLARASRQGRLAVAGNELNRELAHRLEERIRPAARAAARRLAGEAAGRRVLAGIERHRRELAAMRGKRAGESSG